MDLQINSKYTENIYKTPILQQSAFWSEVKRRQGVDSKAFDIKTRAGDIYNGPVSKSHVVDDLLVLFQDIGDGFTIGYVPYGPTLKPNEENQGQFLEELSESLRPHLPAGCVLLRYDLLWESPWARDDSFYTENGVWTGPPARTNQELRLNFDTSRWNLKKANSNILPSDTIFIDLQQDEEALLRAMKPKTRYNVGLAFRRGVRVRTGDNRDLETWYKLYADTCSRNRIWLHDRKYFTAVLGADDADPEARAGVELLIAEIGTVPLAAIFLAYSGRRATYLYGASSSAHRNHMATYGLQWEAIRRAKRRGCTVYDMFGVAPNPDPSHPLYGLYRFKKGFGGTVFHRMGCWDYPLNPENYEMYLASEMQSTGFHLR